MRIKAAVSVLALTGAMLAAPAFAQSSSMMIGETAVSEADNAAVQSRCDDLAIAGDTSLTESDNVGVTNDTNNDTTGNNDSDDATSSNNSPSAEGLDNATSTIDLNTITLEDCQAGGWVTN